MKNNRILKGLILIFVIIIVFMIGATPKSNKEVVKIDKYIYKSTNDFHIEQGEMGIEFSDGSWAIVNETRKEYIFQPVELGDWSMDFNNIKDFKNCVKTYLEIKNR